MKLFVIGAFVLLVCLCELHAQTIQGTSQVSVPSPTPYTIVSQDANSRVWQRGEYEVGPNGQTITHFRRYTEIATGLNYKDANGNYEPAQESISVQPDGTAAATEAQHIVHFPIDIANGQIELVTPEGTQIFSQPEELTYFDGTNAVVLGEITNAVGVLVGDNEVVYPNAFCGIKASLRYTFTKAGFEQDVILLQQPLTPEYYSLNAERARIQIVTEFFNSPNPSFKNTLLPNQAGVSLTDQSLSFGVMRMGSGRAFLLGQSQAEPAAMVAKSWLNISGRQFLVEEVPVNAIVQGLAALPLTAMNDRPAKKQLLAAGRIVLPKQRLIKKGSGKIKFAARSERETGLVLDYQTINSSLTNVTFQCDSTYYLSGPTYLYGTNTFEGGTVLKYSTNASLSFSSTNINWYGSAYRPVILTAKDDNSVGDAITGASGSPTNYYGNPCLSLSEFTAPITLSNVRIKWAFSGASCYESQLFFDNCQFINCLHGVGGYEVGCYFRNTLFANVLTNFSVVDSTLDLQNSTVAGSSCVAFGVAVTPMNVTNCIFANIGAIQENSSLTLSAGYNGFYNCAEFGSGYTTNGLYPFQACGDGNYYLTNGCNFHNWGTTNIDPTLLAGLQTKTTYPPFVYATGRLSLSNSLGIYAQRDNVGNPDVGYHYDPLDYVFGGSDLYSNVTFSAGTAVGYHAATGGVGSSGQPYGLSLNSGASFNTIGTATSPCWVVDYDNVQEGTGGWSDSGWMGSIMFDGNGSGATPQINSTFTKWGRPWALFFRDNLDHGEGAFNDCEFYGGSLATYDTSYLYFTNCLFVRPAFYGFDQDAVPYLTMLNCTYYNGFFCIGRSNGQSPAFWTIENTSFDGTGIFIADNLHGSNSATLFNYNAYNTNNLSGLSYSYPYGTPTNVLEVLGPNDKKISGYNWETSWFGSFYLPTNSPIIEMGSTNANLIGLYHFTTQTNQAIEGTNIVTIGYHYVATDTNGNPLDTNGDGIPDYLEDANGDGIFDPGDLGDWQISPYGLSSGNGLQVFTPLK